MNKAFGIFILFTSFVILQRLAIAVEVAPRISDREIVEGLVEIRSDIKRLDTRIDGLSSKVDDLRSEMNGNFTDLRSEMNGKFTDLRSEMNGKFTDLRSEMNGKFTDLRSEIKGDIKALDKRMDDLRSEINSRFDSLHWTLGIFITIALVILGFVLRMQWQMHQRQTRMETVLETQRDELSFIKQLIEKFLPPKGVL